MAALGYFLATEEHGARAATAAVTFLRSWRDELQPWLAKETG